MQNGKILVVGATGRVGGAAVERLMEVGFEVRALVRQPEKGNRLRSLGAELIVGDATAPDALELAVRGCSGIFSALGAGPGRGAPEDIEYRGNVNLLSAARSAGVGHFVYSSVLMADHPLAQKVGAFREKARFEQELLAAEDVSSTILRPAIFMETLHMMLRGPVAFVPGRQRRPLSWIARPRHSPRRRTGHRGGYPGPSRARRPGDRHFRRRLRASRKGPWKEDMDAPRAPDLAERPRTFLLLHTGAG